MFFKSSFLSKSNLYIITSCVIVILLINQNQVLSCSCMRPSIDIIYNSSDYIAIVTFKSEPVDNSGIFTTTVTATIPTPTSASTSNTFSPSTKETELEREGSSLVHIVSKRHVPLPYLVISSETEKRVTESPNPPVVVVERSESSVPSSKELNKLLIQGPPVIQSPPFESIEDEERFFKIINIIKANSFMSREALLHGIGYINSKTSCEPYISLDNEDMKYLIWGKMYDQKLNLHLCNTVDLRELNENEQDKLQNMTLRLAQ